MLDKIFDWLFGNSPDSPRGAGSSLADAPRVRPNHPMIPDTIVYEESRHGDLVETIKHTTNKACYAVNRLSRLDGDSVTLLSFVRKNETLNIGGGNDGRYFVTYHRGAHDEYSILQNPSPTGYEQITVIVAGMRRLFYPRACVSWSGAARAAAHFVTNGGKSAKLTWEIQP
jgi:hypothetical protein